MFGDMGEREHKSGRGREVIRHKVIRKRENNRRTKREPELEGLRSQKVLIEEKGMKVEEGEQ